MEGAHVSIYDPKVAPDQIMFDLADESKPYLTQEACELG